MDFELTHEIITEPAPPLERSKRWRPEQAAAVLDRWRESGLSLLGFAAATGLNYQRLLRWRAQLAAPAAEPFAFAPVRIRPEKTEAADARMELALPGGVRIRLRPGFDPEALRELLRTLERGRC